jgi:hypothetical protein
MHRRPLPSAPTSNLLLIQSSDGHALNCECLILFCSVPCKPMFIAYRVRCHQYLQLSPSTRLSISNTRRPENRTLLSTVRREAFPATSAVASQAISIGHLTITTSPPHHLTRSPTSHISQTPQTGRRRDTPESSHLETRLAPSRFRRPGIRRESRVDVVHLETQAQPRTTKTTYSGPLLWYVRQYPSHPTPLSPGSAALPLRPSLPLPCSRNLPSHIHHPSRQPPPPLLHISISSSDFPSFIPLPPPQSTTIVDFIWIFYINAACILNRIADLPFLSASVIRPPKRLIQALDCLAGHFCSALRTTEPLSAHRPSFKTKIFSISTRIILFSNRTGGCIPFNRS